MRSQAAKSSTISCGIKSCGINQVVKSMSPSNSAPSLDAEPANNVGVLDATALLGKAESACDFLRAIATPTRLMLLCHLMEGERTVSDLADLVDAKQSLTSHHLNRLKLSGLVASRRDEKFIFYRLKNDVVKNVVAILHEEFCS